MKTLNEYVLKNNHEKNYENYLLEQLCCHCSLEFKFVNGKGLDPRFIFYESIYESLGKFDNAGKVVKHIIKELTNNFTSQKINCKNDNVFFDYIDIEINNEHNGNGSYMKYEDHTIYMKLYSLNVEEFIENINEYEKLFLHELLHGFEDYNRITSGNESIFNLIGDEYANSFKNLNNSNDLKMYLSRCKYFLNPLKMYLSRCKYFLNPQERNAYFSSLESSIKKLLKSGNYYLDKFDFNKFKEDLKHTDIWKIYFDLFIFIEKLKTLSQHKEIIEKTYNQLFEDNKSFKNIIKELQNKWRKFNSKFNQLVPKILCDNLQIKESREFSFTVNKLNKPFEL